MVGELIAASLILHAGSLISLQKCQIQQFYFLVHKSKLQTLEYLLNTSASRDITV